VFLFGTLRMIISCSRGNSSILPDNFVLHGRLFR
jgi:hypothetical protein